MIFITKKKSDLKVKKLSVSNVSTRCPQSKFQDPILSQPVNFGETISLRCIQLPTRLNFVSLSPPYTHSINYVATCNQILF